MRSRRLFVSVPIVLSLLVSGCSTKSDMEASSSGQQTSVKSEWNCESARDGLGENYTCSNTSPEVDGVSWNLTIMCTSDQVSRLAIIGFKSDLNKLLWPRDGNTLVKVRVDSKPVEEWKFAAKGSGLNSFVFFDKDRFDGSNADFLENRGTWKFLSAIAGAKTFGFRLKDAEGTDRSGLFNIENSVPIAAKFNVLGCKST
jgi:hypothetical protein